LSKVSNRDCFAGWVYFEGLMRDAIHSADPAQEDWKRRVAEFARSEMFDRLFKEGMALVEEAATYLDGPGRTDSRKLNRELALVYAAESMEVTTRLMQAASWLVVQRAVREKDMGVEEAGDEKYRIAKPGEPHPVDRAVMPAPLMALVDRSRALYERVWRFDATLYSETPQPADNPVMKQIDRLRQAAEGGAFDPLAVWRR
jgi:regulator of CtrA degradation